eukprot:jgi/Undpi1/5681/HiC_scaffold_2.g00955.m1
MAPCSGSGDEAAEKEWLFDFLLSVFKSPQWDAAVMGFIDENCAVFDTGEENRLSYTDLHHLFKDLVESLCATSLAEVGVDVGDFVEALEASRLNEDISKAVYEQLVALDDFVTFKKLMVKRNVELELEAVHALQRQGVPLGRDEDGKTEEHATEQGKTAVANGSKRVAGEPEGGGMDKKMRKAMDANLRELELMHKREEVEQAELEQAIAMSLALEAKRVELGKAEEGGGTGYSDRGVDVAGGDPAGHPKNGEWHNGKGRGSQRTGENNSEMDCKDDAGDRLDGSSSAGRCCQSKGEDTRKAVDALAEAKCDFAGEAEEKLPPYPPRKGAGSKVLPPISRVRGENVVPFRGGSFEGGECLRDPDVESVERRREARAASEKAKRLLEERRRAQDTLRMQSDVSEEEVAQRERHLKDMRDRIVSAKRAGREEEASKAEVVGIITPSRASAAAAIHETANGVNNITTRADSKGEDDGVLVVNGETVEEDFAEEQRRSLRVALAQDMKRDLIKGEQDRLTKLQEQQLADLHDKLRLVERLRDENSEREADIARAIREQQQQRARSVESSAVHANGHNDEFKFGAVLQDVKVMVEVVMAAVRRGTGGGKREGWQGGWSTSALVVVAERLWGRGMGHGGELGTSEICR